jgi:hypothetical protein
MPKVVDPTLAMLFLTQLSLQCEFLLTAAKVLDDATAGKDFRAIFFANQNLLTAAANISKALWGQGNKPRVTSARRPLRDAIGVSDSSPLRAVTMRNNYEHFDGGENPNVTITWI